MATGDTTSMSGEMQPQKGALRNRKRRRPMTAGQELLFFGISFAVAVVLQLVVLLNFADVVGW